MHLLGVCLVFFVLFNTFSFTLFGDLSLLVCFIAIFVDVWAMSDCCCWCLCCLLFGRLFYEFGFK